MGRLTMDKLLPKLCNDHLSAMVYVNVVNSRKFNLFYKNVLKIHKIMKL